MAAAEKDELKWADMTGGQKVVRSLKICVMFLSMGFIFPNAF